MFAGAALKSRPHPDVPERTVVTEGTAGARISLTIRFAAGLGIDRGFGGVGDGVRKDIEDIPSPDGRGDVLEHLVRQIQVRGPLDGELLARIVVLVAKGAVVILVYARPKRAQRIAQIQVRAMVRGIVCYVDDPRLVDDLRVEVRNLREIVVIGKGSVQAACIAELQGITDHQIPTVGPGAEAIGVTGTVSICT